MTMIEIANRLVELCKADQNNQAVEELYAQDVTTSEGWEGPGMPQTMHGIDAVRKKHEWWYNSVESHGGSVEGPFVHNPDQFAVIFTLDVTMKDSGKRMNMKEVAVYTVKDGKIAKDQFFNLPM
jgi:ketosteroid isomerase-like protein